MASDLPTVYPKAPGCHPPDRRAVGKEDRLTAIGVGIIAGIDLEHGQRFAWRRVADLHVGILVQELLVELDQPMQPGLLRPVFGRIFAPPGSIAFLDPQGTQRTAADRPAAMRGCRLKQRAIQRRLIGRRRSAAPSQDRR